MLVALDPVQAWQRWDWFTEGLEHCIAKTGMHLRQEDVYLRVRAGSALPFVIQHDGVERGFAIITHEYDPDGLVMFIWALWCPDGIGLNEQVTADLDQLQIAMKAKRQRMWGRPGWEKVWGTKIATVFERVGDA